MTPEEIQKAILSISGTMAQFARDYKIPYRTVQDWCLKSPSPAGIALVKEILKTSKEL